MAISIHIEPSTGFVYCRHSGQAGNDDMRGLIEGFQSGRYPADRNVLHDLSEAETLTFEAELVVELTMKRRATIPDRPDKPVCAAVFGMKPDMLDAAQLWTAFFQGDPGHHIQLFKTESEARAWIDRCDSTGC